MSIQDPRIYSLPHESDVSKIIQKVLFHLHPEIESRRIRIDADTFSLTTQADEELVYAAIQNLMQHALLSSPRNGEITLTMIDGNYQWELEVADSSSQSGVFSTNQSDMPHIIDRHLVDAHRTALELGGQIQKWNCPQGGVANVLVVPKRKRNYSFRPAI